jgi:hypothetical protein
MLEPLPAVPKIGAQRRTRKGRLAGVPHARLRAAVQRLVAEHGPAAMAGVPGSGRVAVLRGAEVRSLRRRLLGAWLQAGHRHVETPSGGSHLALAFRPEALERLARELRVRLDFYDLRPLR